MTSDTLKNNHLQWVSGMVSGSVFEEECGAAMMAARDLKQTAENVTSVHDVEHGRFPSIIANVSSLCKYSSDFFYTDPNDAP